MSTTGERGDRRGAVEAKARCGSLHDLAAAVAILLGGVLGTIPLPPVRLHGGEPSAGDAAGPTEARSSNATERILADLAALRVLPIDETWTHVAKMGTTYKAETGLEALPGQLQSLDERTRLAGAAFLLDRSETGLQERGQLALQKLARDAQERPVRIAAIRLLREPVRTLWEAAFRVLKAVADADPDPEIRIEASLSVWYLENRDEFRQPIRLLLEHTDAAVRAAAALALAETGYYAPPVDLMLDALSTEPSDRGRRAELLLRLRPDEAGESPLTPPGKTPSRGRAGADDGTPGAVGAEEPPLRTWTLVVEEIVQAILDNSLQRDKVMLRDLYVAALKGMVSSLDEYSAFLDPVDVRLLELEQSGLHPGLGARLAPLERGAPLTVVRSYPGGPAHRAGLRSGDQVLEINGVQTRGASVDLVRSLASGEAGSEVHLLVRRWNDEEARTMSFRRGGLEMPWVESELLPESIGYLRVRRFGAGAAAQLEKALDALEARGLNALVVDVRDNPGGRLEEAVRSVDFFVGERREPIVREEGPGGRTDWLPSAGEKPYHPTFILVNRGTASAAEVVAGALQDYGRAAVLGQPTFGKGVKQTSLSLSPRLDRLLGGEGRLLLTTRKLLLPLGRPLNAERARNGAPVPGREGGVMPDVVVGDAEERLDEARAAERLRVQFSPATTEFIARHMERVRNLFDEGRPWDPASEEGYDALVRSLETTLGAGQVRRALRAAALRHLEEERGREIAGDLHDDPALRRAVLEALRRLGRDPREVPAYRSIFTAELPRAGDPGSAAEKSK